MCAEHLFSLAHCPVYMQKTRKCFEMKMSQRDRLWRVVCIRCVRCTEVHPKCRRQAIYGHGCGKVCRVRVLIV